MIALVDGDVVAHIACKSRWEAWQSYKGIRKNSSKWSPRPNVEDYSFTEEEATRYINDSVSNAKQHLFSTLARLYLPNNAFLMGMKGQEKAYRSTIYPEYKAHRKKNANPNEYVQIVRDSLVYQGLAIHANWREVDDYLRIWAEEAKAVGEDYIICSNDKDLNCIPGKHFNIKTNDFFEVSEDEALRFSFIQLLEGDKTDNIPGIPGIGPVTARSIISDCNSLSEMREAVMYFYKETYKDLWRDYLLSNGKMLHIQKDFEDYFSLSEWEATPIKTETFSIKDLKI